MSGWDNYLRRFAEVHGRPLEVDVSAGVIALGQTRFLLLPTAVLDEIGELFRHYAGEAGYLLLRQVGRGTAVALKVAKGRGLSSREELIRFAAEDMPTHGFGSVEIRGDGLVLRNPPKMRDKKALGSYIAGMVEGLLEADADVECRDDECVIRLKS